MSTRHMIVVDVETNGLNLDIHEAIEVAWWNLTTGERGTFIPRHTPSKVLAVASLQALRVNRYIDRIADQRQDYDVVELRRLHQQFTDWDEDNVTSDDEPAAAHISHTLAGCNPVFDACFLSKLFAGEEDTDYDSAPWHHRLWDLSAYAAGALRLPELPGLAAICEHLGVDPPDGTAEGDVTATGTCFQKLDQLTGLAVQHRQIGRPDGTWGCACGWVQDKPHRDHVADMVAAESLAAITTGDES